MIEYFNSIDTQWLLAVNSWHCDYMDIAMWMISSRVSWVLPALMFIFIMARKRWKTLAVALLLVAIAVLLTDQLSSGLIKHTVERLRPTHAPAIMDQLHVVHDYRGGLYGFTSSHAANSISVAIVLAAIFRSRWVALAMAVWTLLQCYSRVYLGVHYPGDIVGGLIVGAIAATVIIVLWRRLTPRWPWLAIEPCDTREQRMMSWAVWGNIAIIFMTATVLYSQ